MSLWFRQQFIGGLAQPRHLPMMSHEQLAVLRRTSLVVSHRHGGEVVYSISVPEVRDLLLAARSILSGIIASHGELEAELTSTSSP